MQHLRIVAVTAILLATANATAQESGGTLNSAPVAAPSHAFELDIAVGYTRGFGMVAPNRPLLDVTGAGLRFGLKLDYRWSTRWSVGAAGEYQEFRQEENASARGFATNVGVTYHFSPEIAGDPWLRLGSGYRSLWENNPVGAGSSLVQRHGFELAVLSIGYDIRLSEDIAVAPMLGDDVDMFLWQYSSGANGSSALSSAAVGTFVYAGFQGRFDIGGVRKGGGQPIATEPLSAQSKVPFTPLARLASAP